MKLNVEKEEKIKSTEQSVSDKINKENISDTKFEEVESANEDINQNQEKDNISVLDESYLDKVINKKTAQKEEEVKSEPIIEEVIEEPTISKSQAKDDADLLSSMDYSELSEFLIEALDYGVSKLSCYIAKEDDSSDFEVESYKKKKLVNQLSRVLEKNNMGVSIEMLFAMTAIMIFKTPVTKAMSIRKLKVKQDEIKSRGDKPTAEQKQDDGTVEVIEVEEVN